MARSDERGAFIVLYALLVVALFGMAAIVVDIGAMREDKRRSRSVADAASTAAAGRLNTTGTPAAVCLEAWRYAAINFGETPVPSSPCGAFGSTCNPSTPVSASGTLAGRTVTITHPVPDSHALMTPEISGGGISQAASASYDGTSCNRVGVSIHGTRPSFFGGVVGSFSQSTTTHSVARGITQNDGGENVPVLVVLEPTRCIALDAQSATIEAFGTNGAPGIIRVDSDGTHGSCGRTIDVQGGQGGSSGRIIVHPGAGGVPGVITHFAPQPHGYEPEDVTRGRINVTPTQVAARLSRNLWDAKYHCGSSTLGCVASPSNPSATDYIASLENAYGRTGTPSVYSGSNLSSAFRVYPTDPLVAAQGATCGTMTAEVVVPTGNWYVNCPGTMDLRGTLTFEGGDVVWQNGVSLRGSLTINALASASNRESTVYFRNGNMVKTTSGSTMVFKRSFFYIASGMVEATAGGVISWTAPRLGPFAEMVLWSESSQTHKLWGGADMIIKGIFFMPNAAFEMGGNPSTDALDVQFVAKTAYTQGAAHLKLRGNPDYGVATDATTTRLIR